MTYPQLSLTFFVNDPIYLYLSISNARILLFTINNLMSSAAKTVVFYIFIISFEVLASHNIRMCNVFYRFVFVKKYIALKHETGSWSIIIARNCYWRFEYF